MITDLFIQRSNTQHSNIYSQKNNNIWNNKAHLPITKPYLSIIYWLHHKEL